MVIGVRDEGPDVVQQTGAFEQLALVGGELVKTGLARAVEQLERQAGDVTGVGLVGPAGPHELQHAALADGQLVYEGRVRAA